MTKPLVLILDDDELLARAFQNFLEAVDFEVQLAHNGKDAHAAISTRCPDILILDLLLPDTYGLEVLQVVKKRYASIDVVVVTTESSAEPALQAIRLGAADYLIKPLGRERLVTTVRNLLERRQLNQRVRELETLLPTEGFEGIIGTSPLMQTLYRILDNAAQSDVSVFISGESGTGKELCAHAIHQRSRRAGQNLVAINCAAIPRDLMESEIFGHVKGAFTGAIADRAGAVQRAEGGTLFLDEICDLPLELQPKLLRLLQTRRYQKVGGEKEELLDTRIICGSNKDPLTEVQMGRFREDLFYRLFVLPIDIPPLRQRSDDIEPLLRHLTAKYLPAKRKGVQLIFSAEAAEVLRSYQWPGNVRQLENLVQNLIVTQTGHEITLSDVAPHLHKTSIPVHPANESTKTTAVSQRSDQTIRPLWQQERDIIEQAIALCGGNIPEAARQLGINDSTIYRKRKRWLGDKEA